MSDYVRLSAAEIAQAVQEGGLSAVEIARGAISRAKTLGKDLNAFISLCEESALARAEVIDALSPAEKRKLPLCGVPVAVKDNISYSACPTTCASRMLEGYVPPYDATAVARLVDAGAVIIGKTNMDEFGMGSSSETSHFGPVRNPVDHELVPGGSSGGSAAAVAAGIVPLALGTDTGGSIRQPTSFCGVYGLRPTYGVVSRYGLVAYVSSCDVIGPIARTPEDLALAFRVMAGVDPSDATSIDSVTTSDSEAAGSYRIGVPQEYLGDGVDSEVRRIIAEATRDLRELGHDVAEVSLPLTEHAVAAYYILACAEASSNLSRYDGVSYGYRAEGDLPLREMYERTRTDGLGDEVKRRIMLGTFVLSSGYYDEYYLKAARVRRLISNEFDDAFKTADALLCPVSPFPAFRLGEKMNDPLAMMMCDVHTTPSSLAGLPSVAVPFGSSSDGRPIGVQLVGPKLSEPMLLYLAATMGRENR